MTKCIALNRKPGRDFMRITQYACYSTALDIFCG